MKNFFTKLFGSLDTTTNGFSGRKISAMIGVLTAVYIAGWLLPEKDRIYAVYAFLIFALLCLGLVTVPQLIQFLSDKKSAIIRTTQTTETVSETKKET